MVASRTLPPCRHHQSDERVSQPASPLQKDRICGLSALEIGGTADIGTTTCIDQTGDGSSRSWYRYDSGQVRAGDLLKLILTESLCMKRLILASMTAAVV